MASPTVESLEARFADLQRKVLGDSTTVEEYERVLSSEKKSKLSSNQSVADLLIDANSLMCTALSGREKVNSIVPRMGDLDKYLDPTFEDSQDTSSLVEVLMLMAPSFCQQSEQLQKLSQLSPILDSKEINATPTHSKRLEQLLVTNQDMHDLTEECCLKVFKLVEEYNSIVANITKTLVQWDNVITQIEQERKPKKVVE